jgi:hypothetical protein
MLSFASAAYTAGKELLATFSVNLGTLPGANGDATTMDWWATQPQAWTACRADQEDPAIAMSSPGFDGDLVIWFPGLR